jgi:transposase
MGIDIGKNSLQSSGSISAAIVPRGRSGHAARSKRGSPTCRRVWLVMEACVGTHLMSRKMQAHGHDARLTPAICTRDSKGQKNDFRDTEAIAEGSRLKP